MAVTHLRQPLAGQGRAMEPSISRYGAIVASASLLTVLLVSYLDVTSRHCSPFTLVALYAVGAGEIIILCRATVPSWMQGILILAIIASLTTLTARTDLFGVQHVAATLPESAAVDDNDIATRPASRSASHRMDGEAVAPVAVAGTSTIGAASGARVAFEPASSGDEGWSRRLNASYNRHFGGPAASDLMVSGQVGVKRIGKFTNLEVNWGVSTGGASVRCGSTNAYGLDGPALSDQVSQGIGQAISRSVELRRPSCQ